MNNNQKNKESYKFKIRPSKTEIELLKNFPDFQNINVSNNNKYCSKNDNKTIEINYFYKDSRNKKKFKNLCTKTVRNTKFNYSDLNKYMNQTNKNNNNNTTLIKDYKNKPNKISLNKYFNLDKINNDKKIILNNFENSLYVKRNNYIKNINNISNINNNSNINTNKKSRISKCISYINKKKRKNFMIEDSICNKSSRIIDNNININVNKIKKEKELFRLKKTLKELKSDNKTIKRELNILKKQNTKLDKDNNNQYIIFNNIRNILNKTIKNNNLNIKNKNILNPFNSKLYITSTYSEKAKYIKNLYLEEKLKNLLIEKSYDLYLKSDKIINNGNINNNLDINNNANLGNIYKWIISMVEDINNLKKNNNNIKNYINNLNKDKDIYKNYYNNWINLLKVKNKDELFHKISYLIKYQSMNKNEEAKMFKILNKENK